MKKFEIRYEETMVGYFTVEANSEEEALDEFWGEVQDGEIDLLDTEMMDSHAIVIGEEE